jgi:hypothetical protein
VGSASNVVVAMGQVLLQDLISDSAAAMTAQKTSILMNVCTTCFAVGGKSWYSVRHEAEVRGLRIVACDILFG